MFLFSLRLLSYFSSTIFIISFCLVSSLPFVFFFAFIIAFICSFHVFAPKSFLDLFISSLLPYLGFHYNNRPLHIHFPLYLLLPLLLPSPFSPLSPFPLSLPSFRLLPISSSPVSVSILAKYRGFIRLLGHSVGTCTSPYPIPTDR